MAGPRRRWERSRMLAVRSFNRALQTCARRRAASDLLYTKKHEWIAVKDNVGTVGITDFAAESLGDVVYVETADVGAELAKGDTAGAVESVKAASDIYSPVTGTVVEKNVKLEAEPALLNKSPFKDGWLYKLKVKNAEELKELLSSEQYEQFKKDEEAAH